tara:strand:+ start:537 stop:1334 length:798 start_codon:yes stop_codon:yes gene_type:complete
MKQTPIRLKQKLSPKAAAAKKRRDIAMAKTPARKAKKAENQRIGQRSDSDLHHTGSAVKRVSIKDNRGNFGKGTKNETKGSGFKMRSGNKTSFKMMGSSSPMKEHVSGHTTTQLEGTVTSSGGFTSSSAPEGVYTDPNNPGVNRTWINSRGVTMYRHPDGNSSSIPYDPTKTGVATHGDDRGYYDYMGQEATSGIEELRAKQGRSRINRDPIGRPNPYSTGGTRLNIGRGNRSYGGGNYDMQSQATGTGIQQGYMSAFTKKKKRK